MSDWHPHARALVEQMTADRTLIDPAWREAFEAVPRHLFVPDRALAQAWADDAIVTQTKPAAASGGHTYDVPTSSASAPSAMSVMLDRLSVADGMRVLEIGTGTGYNAALLCHRLGDGQVTSVDIDPQLVQDSATVLQHLGYRPRLTAGDGHEGLPDAAPFDRIIATCSITHIPPAWIRQLANGGRIVAPLHGSHDGALMVLDKTADDEVTGRFDTYKVWFMPLRDSIDNSLAPLGAWEHEHRMAYEGTTRTDPTLLREPDPDLGLFLHLHLPGLQIGHGDYPNGDAVGVHTPHATAIATLKPTGEDSWRVVQRGHHRPWDTVEHAIRRWETLGRPDRTRYGISALDDKARQYIWLDDPNGPDSWPMPL